VNDDSTDHRVPPQASPRVTIVSDRALTGPVKRSLADVILGRRLASTEEDGQRIGPFSGVAVLGLDALSSAAYGPEAALTLLLPLGAMGIAHLLPITGLIVGILFLVYLSYRQTIHAYPNGGGSYTVVKENLGQRWALLAGAALALDYILNVAVGISAGVGALVSAVPGLQSHTLALCLGILGFLTLVNLRGTRESGLTFLLPTYLFVGALVAVLTIGCVRASMTGGHPAPIVAPPALAAPTEVAGVWLLMRAFASGCTAMTGVEAVSNGVPVFRVPTIANANRALSMIIALLVVLLLGVAYLCSAYGIGATDPGSAGYQSVLSQLAGAVLGRGVPYYVTMGSIVAVLALSANTSFADFPRLCRVIALDRFLPDIFAIRGRRLIFSYGVIALSVFAGALLVAFDGTTDRLIPLFAIGAFLAFTLSQAGMVQHWRRLGGSGSRRALLVNGVGALATGVTLVVVVISKFLEGAWIAALVIPVLVLLFARVNRHYLAVAADVADEAPLILGPVVKPIVVIPIQSWNKLASRALRFGLELSPDVRALHVLREDSSICELTGVWEELVGSPSRAAGLPVPRLVLRRSTYRQFFTPFVDYVERTRDENPERDIVVVVPDLVVSRWYHAVLHNNRGAMLRALLRLRGGPRVVVVNLPYHLGRRTAA
jgi:amino acid transporter